MSSAPPGPSELAPCSRGGRCCRGQGRTPVTESDLTRMARFLDQSVADLRVLSVHRDPDGYVLKSKNPLVSEIECLFLGPTGCTIYEARPEACRTWPLWKRLHDDPVVFEKSRQTCAMIRHMDHGTFRNAYSQARDESHTDPPGVDQGFPR